jgi:hypothetical protein
VSESTPSNYEIVLRAHFSNYKRDVLGIARNGSWHGVEYGHILPADRSDRNIIEPYRDEFWDYWAAQENHIKHLHEGFSHLNSSQALCFNLFFPFLADDRQLVDSLLTICGLPPEHVRSAEFECRARDGTYMDFCCATDRRRVSFEVKLSEAGFGAAQVDEEHIRKLDTVYATRGSYFVPSFCEPSEFFRNYQICRTIMQIRPKSEDAALFVYPKANGQLHRSEHVIRTCALPHVNSHVHIVYLETLLDSIDKVELNRRARSHYRQVREKYLV